MRELVRVERDAHRDQDHTGHHGDHAVVLAEEPEDPRDSGERERAEDERDRQAGGVEGEQQAALVDSGLGAGGREDRAERRARAGQPRDGERQPRDHRSAGRRAANQRLRAPLAVEARHEHHRHEQDAQGDDQDRRDVPERGPVVLEGAAEAGGGHPERDEHDRERQAEEQRRPKDANAPAALAQLGEGDAGDRRQVAGDEWEDAGRDERDEADRKRGEHGRVDVAGGDRGHHRS